MDVPGLELRGTALEEEGAGGDVVVIAPSSLATNAGGSAAGGRFFLLLDFLPLLDLFFTMISSSSSFFVSIFFLISASLLIVAIIARGALDFKMCASSVPSGELSSTKVWSVLDVFVFAVVLIDVVLVRLVNDYGSCHHHANAIHLEIDSGGYVVMPWSIRSGA